MIFPRIVVYLVLSFLDSHQTQTVTLALQKYIRNYNTMINEDVARTYTQSILIPNNMAHQV